MGQTYAIDFQNQKNCFIFFDDYCSGNVEFQNKYIFVTTNIFLIVISTKLITSKTNHFYFQNLKNQIMTTNLWVEQVGGTSSVKVDEKNCWRTHWF